VKRTSRFRPKPNYFWVVLSTTIILFLIGLFGFFTIHSSKLFNTIKEDIKLVAELKSGSTADQRGDVLEFLNTHEMVKEGSVAFVSKEEGLVGLQSEMGVELLPGNMPNPLFDVITFGLKSQFTGKPEFEEFKKVVLGKYNQIEDLHYQSAFVDRIFGMLDKAWWGILAVCSVLTLLALILMHNTIRIALYDKRDLIRNMELIGASWAFISRPFIKQSLKHTLYSLIASFLLIACTFALLGRYFPSLRLVQDNLSLAWLAGFLIVIGLLIHLATTWFYLRRYLKMHIWDMNG
jgi:cell division transport system permease protein